MKKSIFHIYHATQGNAGLYTDQIYRTLESHGYDQKIYVSYYYPFNYGKKIFFKHTDLISGAKKTKFRLYLRYLELIKGLIITLFSIIRYKPSLINYSLINVYYPELLFLKLTKRLSSAKIIITCHDVVPFNSKHSDNQTANKRRLEIFNLADYLLVHNSNSIDDLVSYYHIEDKSKILIHKFPILDLSRLVEINTDTVEKTIDFLFIGHLREEKGVNVLLEAWGKLHNVNAKANLYIAGNLPNESDLSIEEYEDMNITFDLGYLSDIKYCQLIQKAKYVILPYLRGTNSGVASTVLSLGTDIIASNIPMFTENSLINENNRFQVANTESLVQLLERVYGMNYQQCDIVIMVSAYQKQFESEVISVYDALH